MRTMKRKKQKGFFSTWEDCDNTMIVDENTFVLGSFEKRDVAIVRAKQLGQYFKGSFISDDAPIDEHDWVDLVNNVLEHDNIIFYQGYEWDEKMCILFDVAVYAGKDVYVIYED